MKNLFSILQFFIVLLLISACVPAKKYKDLLEREKVCSEELAKFKKSSGEYEALSKDLQTKFANASRDLSKLILDTTALGNKYRLLLRNYNIIDGEYKSLQKSFDKLKNLSARETAELQNQLEAKNNELQIKEDALLKLDQELKEKQRLLIEREKRVNELEEAIRKKEAAVQLLKAKVANALRGFENQGLSVVQKNGKIYVSLEAKLLFKSGSTFVEEEGVRALVELGKALESEKDLEIIVEGHTDTDKLNSSASPKNNWELSVLRATSVVQILLNNSSMTPSQIMAGGRGEFLPIDESDKAKNRRIEVIISPNLNELFEIISNE
ncbi:MAG: cell envelope biogenesis protein OmpA [Flavobacteriia bacterium]|nr:cell envelope biogenesis protein OmpA [Flavobacteriia bacterium]